MRKTVVVLGIALLLTAACSEGEKTEGTVIASVNSEVLTMEELIYQIPAEYRNQLNEEGLNNVIESWVNTELLYQRAVEKGLDEDPEIKAIIKAGTREAIARKMVDSEMSLRTFVPTAMVDSIYRTQQESFKLEKDRLRASHILLPTKGEADAIYGRLKKNGDFAVLARDYSGDRTTAEGGGDIGYFTSDSMDPDFYRVAANLKVGSYSKPVQTTYGFHLIMLTDRLKAGADLDSLEAKQRIYDNLYSTRHAEAFEQYINELKSTATIERIPLTDSLMLNAMGQSLP
ncbi:MAG: peptidylprolyl isomerase [candidate division Zixibacteria bacterium]